jgi:drug/metabolite transporter (DMT)-like permease
MRNPWLLLTFSSLVWGGNVVAARWAVGEISPMVLVGLRWIVVSALIAGFMGQRLAPLLTSLRPHWAYLLPMGVLGFTISNAMLYEGARFTSGVNVAIIQGVLPVLVLAGARVVYGVRAGLVRWIGVAITMAGIVLIATEGEPARILDLQINKGDALVFLGAAIYAAFTLALRKRPPMSAMAFFIGVAIAALVSSAPAMMAEAMLGEAIWPGWRGMMVLLYVAIFTSIVGQICWIRAVEIIGPGRAGVFQNLVPVVGAILSVLVLRESFHWHHAVSLALVLSGLFISEMGKR